MPTVEERVAGLFKALGHPVRIQILNLLRDGEECVCHISSVLGLPQPYVSQQLAVLRRAGLVAVRKEGLNTYYRLADNSILYLLDEFLNLLASEDVEKPSYSITGVIRMPQICPCPKCRALEQITRNLVGGMQTNG